MHVPGNVFSTCSSNWNHVPYEIFLELCAFQRSVQKLKKKLNFLSLTGAWPNKNLEIMKL